MALDVNGVGCSSSSYGSTKRRKYDVFLSFRGEDTRTSFTDHLYDSLRRKGLRTFRHEEGLERGQYINPSLLQAIEESCSAIVVLSPGFASSTWCLDELQKILHSKKEVGLQVFPIFYGVDPSDVRKQKGSFEEAFMKHEERFTQDKMKVHRWRHVLEEVASLSGWDSRNKHETEFIESIAKEMKSKLHDESPFDLGALVGIESKLDELESLIAIDSEGVRSIGIWGTGGLGKTTLARAFYDWKCKDFEVCCFLHNIREEYEKGDLISLQRNLLFSLNNKRSVEVDDCYEGIKLIKNMLQDRKILLVLDDVSDIGQLEYLAREQGWFGNGSRIILTIRGMRLLSLYDVSAQYNIGFLSGDQSLQLFRQNAFKGKNQPNEGYLILSKNVIEYAGGLPLVLKVLGSLLCGRTIEEWEDALAKFKKVPPKDILKILNVCFDRLDDKEKTIFLDIACFFNGIDKDRVTQILETFDEDLYPKIGITILIEKSLVINREGRLWVHHILQDMGKYIVLQESFDKRSRIMSLKDANDVLKTNKGIGAIRGIALSLEKSSDELWDPEAFSKMSNLKLLIISSCSSHVSRCQLNLPRGLKSLPNELRVFEWEGYPLDSLPRHTQPDKLVHLKMRHSKLKQLWRGTQSLQRLMSIDLSHSKYLIKTPNFDGIPNLERLILKGCSNLVEIHQSLGQHKNLVIVNLKGCIKVKILPRKFEMDRLQTFVLSGCSKIRKLPEFGKDMKCLSKLDLEDTSISKLPESLGNLIGLAELDLSGCKNLVCLPNNDCKLIARNIITISGWSKLSRMPEDLNENGALEVLDVGCRISKEAQSICEYNGQAHSLTSWSRFSLLRKAFGFQRPSNSINLFLSPSFSSLTELHLECCNLYDGSLPDNISSFASLATLNLSGNNFIDLPSGLISNLSKLQWIVLFDCPMLKSLPQLPSNLSVIWANGSPSMEHYICSQKLWEFIDSFQSQPDFMQPGRQLIIPGSEVPSWFHNQDYFCEKELNDRNVSFIVSTPEYCRRSEWWGIATCLVIENDLANDEEFDAVWWTSRFPNDEFPNTYGCSVIVLQADWSRQLCIIYIRCSSLVVNKLQMVFFTGLKTLGNDESPKSKVRKCGWRVVCKEDVETWNECCSSINDGIIVSPKRQAT
ncbi:TMV resistance protein N-like isoform X2 [Prosopis cineraria]|uniref:TMV resistance protein N-like isoform X2 n=1 Tax=Prosopis cineraria TaxID=364024 RepID=UPI00240EAA98|nr:TMV resistance protein N-like isoform X2 [Prosopis cineraria]